MRARPRRPGSRAAPAAPGSRGGPMDYEEITLHGHCVGYRRAGWGPVIVLIHGITGSSATWEDVIEPLAERYTVVAPDLLGHGKSAKPRGDYSLGAYASGLRDLLSSLGDVGARHAFIQSLRAVIDPGGQRVDARDRIYLAERVPTMLMWGERDPIIPVRHGRAAVDMIPGARF